MAFLLTVIAVLILTNGIAIIAAFVYRWRAEFLLTTIEESAGELLKQLRERRSDATNQVRRSHGDDQRSDKTFV